MRNKLWTIGLTAAVIVVGISGIFFQSLWVSGQDEPAPPVKNEKPAPPPEKPAPPAVTPTPTAPVELKIGVVNTEILYEKYKKAADYNKLLENEARKLEAKIQEMDKAISSLAEELGVLDRDSELRNEKKMELERLRYARDQQAKNVSDAILKKSDEYNGKIYREIRAAIDAYAKENNYTLIFKVESVLPEKTSMATIVYVGFRSVLYAHPSMDITNAILKILNKE